MNETLKRSVGKLLSIVLTGAFLVGLLTPVRVAAAAKAQDGDTVQITAEQAMTYSPKTKNNVPGAAYYPLPKGALDKVTGKRITYKKNGKTYYYYNLASGLRVSSNDIKVVTKAAPKNNRIQDLQLKTDDRYTYILLETDQKVTYKVKYTAECMTFTFHNTTATPNNTRFRDGGFFSRAEWDNNKLSLYFSKKNAFMGYKGYYNNNGNLVLRFNNIPKSVKEVRVAIDAGHGGKDNGALGSNPKYHEKHLNQAIAKYLAAELEKRGATVKLLNASGKSPQKRREMAEDWGAHIFVSVHCNSAPNKSAAGTEVYYFQVFNKSMAGAAATAVSNSLDTVNRGGRKSYYHVTLSSQMKSMMVETGFLSNTSEYKKLTQKKYQQRTAKSIADALEKNIKSMN